MNPIAGELSSLAPHSLLAAGACAVLYAGAFTKRSSRFLFAVSLASVLAGGVAAAALGKPGAAAAALLDPGFYGAYFVVLIAGISAITLLFARQYSISRNFSGDEFYGLLLFSALGMGLTACALNWCIFFLGLELMSLPLYVLIAVQKESWRSQEAGIKYFIVGAAAGSFLVFGIAVLYSATGTLGIVQSLGMKHGQGLPVVLLALAFILTGICLKLSIVPFHLWAPDVYQGAPAPVAAFLATGSKVAVFAALIRLALAMSPALWSYAAVGLWVLAALTMAAGTITALGQSSLKRLLAYSSVAHMGYVLMTLLAVRQSGLSALLFYLAAYALMDLGAFGILGSLSAKEGDRDEFTAYRGLGFACPWRCAALTAALFALAGLPPTAGFMGKFIIFTAVVQSQFITLAAVGIVSAVVSIFFYMKVVVCLYMHPIEKTAAAARADCCSLLATASIVVLLLLLGCQPAALLGLLDRIVAAGTGAG